MTVYNPIDGFYKSVIGAVKEKESIKFRVKGDFNSVLFVFKKDGEKYSYIEMIKNGDCFELEKSFDVGLYFYHFKIDDKYTSFNGDLIGFLSDSYRNYQLTVYSRDFTVPDLLQGGVIYQIFPDRFYSANNNKNISGNRYLHNSWKEIPNFYPDDNGRILNNDFFGGDIKGIVSKLDYIKSLGITAIYLNPIFKAYSNHRYDTGDYMTIDEILGDEEDLKELIDCTKKTGISIILDGVFNHTGADSKYFNKYGNYDSLGAYQSKQSQYYGWYNFTDYPNEYGSWWGVDTLPSVNESNKDFVNFITGENGVLDYYTKLGVSGWRLDVVDELPDEFVKKIRSSIKNVNPNAIIIGEVWEDASNKIAYSKRREYFLGEELDSVMNYPLKNAIIDFIKGNSAKNLSNVIKEQIDHYPKMILHCLMNMLSTHDTVRLISALSNFDISGMNKEDMSKLKLDEKDKKEVVLRLKMASLLQYTLCGVPSLYYGDEIGMEGFFDPLNRCAFAWDNMDEEILSWYRFLGELRKNYSVFNDGEYIELFVSENAIVFERTDREGDILVGVNNGKKICEFNYDGELLNLIDNKVYKDKFILNGKSFCLLVNEKK